MATSTIHERFIIKDKKALDNLDKACANPRKLCDAKTMTEQERLQGLKVAEEWLSSRSEKSSKK